MLLLALLLSAGAEEQPTLIRVGGQALPADRAGQDDPRPAGVRTISLDLQSADIHSVLRLFADVSGMNFVASDDVKGTVTVTMQDVPWDQALAVILLSKGLAAESDGQRILMVEPIAGR